MPLPLGEVSPQVTERASLSPESRRTVIGSPFVRVILSSGLYFAVSILALSVSHSLASLSQRESLYTLRNFAFRCSSSGSSSTGGADVCRGGEMGFSIST